MVSEGKNLIYFCRRVAANACRAVSAEGKVLVLMGIGEMSGILTWMPRILASNGGGSIYGQSPAFYPASDGGEIGRASCRERVCLAV